MRRQEIEVAEVFQAFVSAGLSPILIKGWAAARNYPTGTTRSFGDIDVAIRREEFDRAFELVSSSNFPNHPVDIHCELRHYDLTPWPEIFERTKIVELDAVPVRLLSAEDHLRVLCVHWLNDGGEYKQRLWDIYYAVENRPSDFDWDLCLNSVSPTRRKWVTTAISIAHKYLQLDVSDLGLSKNDLSIPGWVERTLEREWSSDLRLRPLQTCLRQPSLFIRQILKRIPPNPIQATVEGEGEFDERSRIPIQLKTGIRRVAPSLKRITSMAMEILRK